MNSEEIVELTPGADSVSLAQQLLAAAALPDNPYRVDDVKTTSSGPMGLAFLVPAGLYEAWQASLGIPADATPPPATEPVEAVAAPRPPRARKAAAAAAAGGE